MDSSPPDELPRSSFPLAATVVVFLLLANLTTMLLLLRQESQNQVSAQRWSEQLAVARSAAKERCPESPAKISSAQLRTALRAVRQEWLATAKPETSNPQSDDQRSPRRPRVKKTKRHLEPAAVSTLVIASAASAVSSQVAFLDLHDHDRLWTEESLRDKDLGMLVHVQVSGAAALEPWSATLAVTRPGDSTPVRVFSHARTGPNRSMRLPVGSLALASPAGAPLDLNIVATADSVESTSHAPVAARPSRRSSRAERSLSLRLSSFADLAAVGAVQLRLTPGSSEGNAKHKLWFQIPAEPGGPDTAPLVLQLYKVRDLDPILPMLRSAASLTAAAGEAKGAENADSVCFIRRATVRMCAWGQQLDASRIAELATMVGAELAFRGPVSAYLGQPKSPAELAPILAAAPGHIFIYEQRDSFRSYPVPATFVGRNAAAADYLADGTTAIFNARVELLPLKATAH